MTTLYTTVEDKETKETGSVFAIVKDQPGTVAVSLPNTGATRFYCVHHHRMFLPKDSCPECNLKTELRQWETLSDEAGDL